MLVISVVVIDVTESYYCFYYYVHVQLLSPNTLNRTHHSQTRVDIVVVIAGGCDALNTVFLLLHSFVVHIYDCAKPPNR